MTGGRDVKPGGGSSRNSFSDRGKEIHLFHRQSAKTCLQPTPDGNVAFLRYGRVLPFCRSLFKAYYIQSPACLGIKDELDDMDVSLYFQTRRKGPITFTLNISKTV